MNKMLCCFLLAFMFVLQGCNKIEEIELPSDNLDDFSYEVGKKIPFINIEIPYSKISGNIEAFRRYKKPIDDFSLVFLSSELKSHQIIFEFDGVYPINEMHIYSLINNKYTNITNIQILISLDGHNYKQTFSDYEIKEESIIKFNHEKAKSVKITFTADATYILDHVHFTLGEGMIIKERKDWSDLFLRYEGWTGADGIFSFNLDGNREMWQKSDHNLLIFSDTIVGDVYTHNNLRKNFVMINNSFGIVDSKQNINFIYDEDVEGVPKSVLPATYYMGKSLHNLLDSNGFDVSRRKEALLTNNSDGTMFLTKAKDAYMELDFFSETKLDSLYIWNYNDEIDYGTKVLTIYYSSDNKNWVELKNYNLPKATNSNNEAYSLEIKLDIEARYLKITLDDSYHNEYIGLGKLMFFDNTNNYVYAKVQGTSSNIELTNLDQTGRLWLQDGIVIDNYFYTYPIYVKDHEDLFKVFNVGLIKIPIVNNNVDYKNAIYLNSPLQTKTKDGGEIFFGAGILDNTIRDGYVYIYGYKDLNGRNLVVGRYKLEDIENFNAYEFYNGLTWTKDIEEVGYLKDRVSAELSVTYIPSGMYEGKYMLVVMENTMGGTVSYAISDSPYNVFGKYNTIYQATEYLFLNKAFAYNAKLHPTLSDENRFLISYNVNTQNVGALSDVRIYYPRFIEMIEVKGRK